MSKFPVIQRPGMMSQHPFNVTPRPRASKSRAQRDAERAARLELEWAAAKPKKGGAK
jgi:hypothetical protein